MTGSFCTVPAAEIQRTVAFAAGNFALKSRACSVERNDPPGKPVALTDLEGGVDR